MYITDNYDVVVIGAGHAGVEAGPGGLHALAAGLFLLLCLWIILL